MQVAEPIHSQSLAKPVARPMSPRFGVDVDGIRLDQLAEQRDDAQIAWLQELLDTRLLIRFRDQRLTQKQMTTFVGYFGPLLALRNEGATHSSEEGIKLITNEKDAAGKAIGDPPPYDLGWHTDGSYTRLPASYTALYCRTAPSVDAPKTYWMNMKQTLARLDPERQRELAGMRMLHYHPKKPTIYAPEGSPMVGICRAVPHPVVRQIPQTGEWSLFIPSVPDSPIVSRGERWSQPKSAELISQLFELGQEHGDPIEATLQPNDLVFWDNRTIAHRRDHVGPTMDRVLWHSAVQGEEPIEWDAARGEFSATASRQA